MDAMLAYLANSLAWSVVGFLGGFVVGRLTSDVHRISERMDDVAQFKDRPETDPPGSVRSGAVGPTGRPWRRRASDRTGRVNPDRLLTYMFIGLALVTVIQGLVTQSQLRGSSERTARVSACQAEYNREVSKAFAIRQEISSQDRAAVAQDRAALIKLVSTITAPNEDGRAVVGEALREFLAETQEAQQKQQEANVAREQNPLPDPSQIDKCLDREDDHNGRGRQGHRGSDPPG